MTVPMKTAPANDIMESVIAKGDLAKLAPDERVQYYNSVCRSMGLNPLTQPFSYITLNGKLTLYATRTCTDQLRKINSVSLEIVSREVTDGILTVHVRAKLQDGRADEDLGAVAFPDTLKGELRANAELKAVTKAKRRATLSICGLGWLDETEIEDIPASAKRPAKPAPNLMLPSHDTATGEITSDELGDCPIHGTPSISPSPPPAKAAPSDADPAPPTDGAASLPAEITELDGLLAEAAKLGTAALQVQWKKVPAQHQATLKAALDRRHKPNAMEADRAPA